MSQKSIIQLVQQVSGELNLPQPQIVVSSQDQNVLKLLALARSVADDLLAEHDWQSLQTRYSFNTVSGTDNYAFPSDIERFIDFTIHDSTSRWPVGGSLTPGQWEWLKSGFVTSAPYSRYRIWGDKIYLDPVPSTSVHSMTFEYVSNAYVRDGATGLPKQDFTQDADICVFDHRVMVYGIKLKWLGSISQDTTAAMVDFTRALEFSKGSDTPSQRLNLGGARGMHLLSTANYVDGNWNGV